MVAFPPGRQEQIGATREMDHQTSLWCGASILWGKITIVQHTNIREQEIARRPDIYF